MPSNMLGRLALHSVSRTMFTMESGTPAWTPIRRANGSRQGARELPDLAWGSHMDDARQAPVNTHISMAIPRPSTDFLSLRASILRESMSVDGLTLAILIYARRRTPASLRIWCWLAKILDWIGMTPRLTKAHAMCISANRTACPTRSSRLFHGVLYLLAQYKAFNAIPGLIAPTLEQYTHPW